MTSSIFYFWKTSRVVLLIWFGVYFHFAQANRLILDALDQSMQGMDHRLIDACQLWGSISFKETGAWVSRAVVMILFAPFVCKSPQFDLCVFIMFTTQWSSKHPESVYYWDPSVFHCGAFYHYQCNEQVLWDYKAIRICLRVPEVLCGCGIPFLINPCLKK